MGRPENTHEDVESKSDQESTTWRDWAIVISWCVLGYLCIILTVIGYFSPSYLPIDPSALLFNKEVSPFFAFSRGSGYFPKPHGFKIVALVPFRYHERTEILDCYLRKNLVQNHGFLDQVVFVPQTHDAISLEWLKSTVIETPEYAMAPPGQDMDWKITRDNVMYIRIDGDVVFLEDHTIPTIVKTKLDNPEALMVSANVVNEAALASLHSHPGVALPYLPELHHIEQSHLSQAWRASSLPEWQGPASFRVQKGFKPPFEGHRWLLPTEPGSDRDPIAASVYTDIGPTMKDWTVAAQQHYSFLHHLELNTLERYKFPMWVEPTEPISQNFGCFWGRDARTLRELFEFDPTDNELRNPWIGANGTRPHVNIDGKGLASHYSASSGAAGLDSTDLLDRYRAYAQEKVCRYIS
ncbi:hypothetical protein N7520_001791 [Penicillium odoratum]|uniref:uncharacterized protein n=1 Tax=Penicillium odoratum TaxID=1167516 RepID=UPI002548BB67|nr:uncharacterized protein N7520_001791 [Penicillium odoratum]KAJ5778545.1 hypothetical protein N7520_001791 [Penicillium odoratum]